MDPLELPAHGTKLIGMLNLAAGGAYEQVCIGQQARLVLDGVRIRLDRMTLDRTGTRCIELINGAQLLLGELSFASLGASIVYRIGRQCSMVFDANLSEPETVSNSSIQFDSQGSGHLTFIPFEQPGWHQHPQIDGYTPGDRIELGGSAHERYEVADGRIRLAASERPGQGKGSGR